SASCIGGAPALDGGLSLVVGPWSDRSGSHALRARINVVSDLLGGVLLAVFFPVPLKTSGLHSSRAPGPGLDPCPFPHRRAKDSPLASSRGFMAVLAFVVRSSRVSGISGPPFVSVTSEVCHRRMCYCRSDRSMLAAAGL